MLWSLVTALKKKPRLLTASTDCAFPPALPCNGLLTAHVSRRAVSSLTLRGLSAVLRGEPLGAATIHSLQTFLGVYRGSTINERICPFGTKRPRVQNASERQDRSCIPSLETSKQYNQIIGIRQAIFQKILSGRSGGAAKTA
jgi:hypothetical protein